MRQSTRLLALLLPVCLSLTAARAKSPEEFLGEKPAPAASKPAAAPPAAAATPAKPAAASPAVASPKPSKGRAPQPMDTARIHELYLEGDFDLAIRALEAQMNSRRPMSHAESVFVFKHLGVMYAASGATREKGTEYMQKLIYIEPTAKILDMYASDMIHLIFRNVQEEFESKRARLKPPPETTAVATAPAPAPAPAPPPVAGRAPQPSSRNRRTFYMAAAGAGVAVGAFALFMLLSEDEPKTRTIVITE